MSHKYSIHLLWSEEDAAYIASVMELPGCMADGATPQAAVEMLDIVVAQWIETAQKLDRPIPEPCSKEKHEEMQKRFREHLEEHVKREVKSAVQRVLSDLQEYIPAMAKDPADYWKSCN